MSDGMTTIVIGDKSFTVKQEEGGLLLGMTVGQGLEMAAYTIILSPQQADWVSHQLQSYLQDMDSD